MYRPTRGRYKVYLIDEVHMLSTHSFNALLKTLEEPPPHVKFLLATTDPQKLPVTVLSRCLQFNLKRLPLDLIAGRLRQILEAEGVAAEPGAVALLARAADGSLRDALSLLDQLLAYGAGRVTEADARAMLGTVERREVAELVGRMAERDARGMLEAVAALDAFAPDYAELLDAVAALLQKVALRQVVPDLPDDGQFAPELLDSLAGGMASEDVQLCYQIAILGRRDLDLAPDPRSGLEMTLLRMLAFRPAGLTAPAPAVAPATQCAPSAPPAAGGASPAGDDWPALLAGLELGGAARQLASHCRLVGRDGNRFRLRLDPRAESLNTRQQSERLAQALSRAIGATASVEIEIGEDADDTPARREAAARDERIEQARQALERDPNVQALRDRFGAVIQPDSVKPVG